MEQQEEEKKMKTSRRRRRRRRQSSSMLKPDSSIPPDLVSEILLKLPTKSIVRFRYISKLWLSITTDSYFISSFETRSSPKPSLLIIFKAMEKSVVFSFPQHHQNSNEPQQFFYCSQPLDCFQIKYRQSIYFPSTESVHGLICFRNTVMGYETPVIWNPTTRRVLTLSRPEKSTRTGIRFFLGYDPTKGLHKVVCMPRDEFCDECWILTLNQSSAKESYWRRIKTNISHLPLTGNGRCINGVLYYKSYLGHIGNQVLMSFDVRSEKFQPITLSLDSKLGLMIVYEGRLAFVHSDHVENGRGIKLSILVDAEKQEWSDKYFRAFYKPYRRFSEPEFKLSGVTEGGEFIYLPSAFLNSFYIVYFDPKKDSSRKVVLEGICDRLGHSFVNVLQAFPNHIESLISL